MTPLEEYCARDVEATVRMYNYLKEERRRVEEYMQRTYRMFDFFSWI